MNELMHQMILCISNIPDLGKTHPAVARVTPRLTVSIILALEFTTSDTLETNSPWMAHRMRLLLVGSGMIVFQITLAIGALTAWGLSQENWHLAEVYENNERAP